MQSIRYDTLMESQEPYIVLNLDLQQPAELTDFVSAFLALSSQFEVYTRKEHPDIAADAKIYVREIKQGSIEAILIPLLPIFFDSMDKALIVEQFVRLYGSRISAYFSNRGRDEGASKRDLKDILNAVKAIAKDPDASAKIEAVAYEDGKAKTKLAIKFNTAQAKTATREIEAHKKELDLVGSADYERVLMTFKRSDVGDSDLGVRSGERVIIEEIAEVNLALIYGARLAEERIKDQMRNTEENIYHKGFVVDVNVTTRGGKPVAYNVTNLHQIIDLPPD